MLDEFWRDKVVEDSYLRAGETGEEFDHERANQRYQLWLEDSIGLKELEKKEGDV
jgi:hypothetical protein